jgi:hypothetical protein
MVLKGETADNNLGRVRKNLEEAEGKMVKILGMRESTRWQGRALQESRCC